MNPAACRLTGAGGKDVNEGSNVVVENLLALGNLLGRCRGAADRLKLGFGRPFEFLAGGDLNEAPGLKTGGVGPQRADLVARVPIDPARRILSARWPAFLALSRPTEATGTPGGIWTTERIASSPPAALRLLDKGTPITGRSVCAAATPGSAAESPAPAMITFIPRVRALAQ